MPLFGVSPVRDIVPFDIPGGIFEEPIECPNLESPRCEILSPSTSLGGFLRNRSNAPIWSPPGPRYCPLRHPWGDFCGTDQMPLFGVPPDRDIVPFDIPGGIFAEPIKCPYLESPRTEILSPSTSLGGFLRNRSNAPIWSPPG